MARIERGGGMNTNPKRNGEGYMDLTAYYAIRAADSLSSKKKRTRRRRRSKPINTNKSRIERKFRNER
jgi:hypothetical protein